LDVNVLGLLEGLEALLAQLAAEARLLEAAERPGVVVGERVVEPDRSGLDLAHAAHDGLQIACVDVGAEAEAREGGQVGRGVCSWQPRVRGRATRRARSAPPGRRSPRAAGRSALGRP